MGVITLATDTVTIATQPEPGGKILSLRHEPSGRQWLLQPLRGPVSTTPDGIAFTDADMCGWDEMFPTIVACPDPARPEVTLPDHGALWPLPWTVDEQSDRHVTMSVSDRSAAYTFRRTIQVAGQRISLDYAVTQHADTALYALWAAHPQFAAKPSTRVILPAGTAVLNALEGTFLGPKDTPVTWPVARPGGTPYAVDRLADAPHGRYWKLYADPSRPVTSAVLADEDGPWLHMTWSGNVPYAGLWMDQTAFADAPVIAIEPSTGYYDAVSTAAQLGRVPILHRGQSLSWQVSVDLGSGPLPHP